MNKKTISINDELLDSNGNFTIEMYCCPIFISHQFGVFLYNDNQLFTLNDGVPEIRSATLTFIEYEGQIYGITCRHVVKHLEKMNKVNQRSWQASLKDKNWYPPELQLHFYVPHKNFQIHLNSKFYNVPGDEFTKNYPDVAIARISSDFIQKIERSALCISSNIDPTNKQQNASGFCGLATGFPEQKRIKKKLNKMVSSLGVTIVNAYAPFDNFSDNQLTLFAELNEGSDVNSLSGMSGGPIIWSNEDSWGLAGIVKTGRDMNIATDAIEDSIFDGPVIWIDGERLTYEKIVSWIKSLPEDDEKIPDLSKMIVAPKNI